MALFRYKAATRAGEVVEGEMQAGSQDAVIRRLQAEGRIPIRAEEIAPPARPRPARPAFFSPRRVTRRDVEYVTLELATLLQAGLTLDRSLEVLEQLAPGPALRDLLGSIHREVRGGAPLSAALEAQGAVFSRFYVNMVRAGEAGGVPDTALARLGEFMQRSRDLRETLTSALVYPAILVFIALGSITVILTFVVPRFAQMFEEAGQTLPLATRVVIATGGFFQHWWWLFLAVAVVLWLWLRRQWHEPAARARLDAWLLRMPLAGGLILQVETARFTRTLGTLLHNGVPLPVAVGIAREIVGNAVIAQGVGRVATSIREGQGLARPVQETGVFPPLAARMLQVGEETGNLEQMLLRMADIYEREVRTAVRRLVAVVEPVMILGLGLLIGGIILSIVVAILQVNQLAV